jgi:hypothetical protein
VSSQADRRPESRKAFAPGAITCLDPDLYDICNILRVISGLWVCSIGLAEA